MSIQQEKHYLQNQIKMRFYYYLLFRLYKTLTEPKKGNTEGGALYLTTSTSTFFCCFFLIVIVFYIDFYILNIVDLLFSNQNIILLSMVLVGFMNYYFFVKPKTFLNYNFKQGKKGGYAIIVFIVLLAISFVFIVNKNKEKIFQEREKARIENKK